MNYTQLNIEPLGLGYGFLFQGGRIDREIDNIPGPLVIVNMMKGESDEQWLHRSRVESLMSSYGHVQSVLSVCIEDNPASVLPDGVLLALIDNIISFLRQGINVYVHCRMGLSRSSYATVGVFMRLKGWTLKQAVDYVGSQRKEAHPNWGFYDHLKSLRERKLL